MDENLANIAMELRELRNRRKIMKALLDNLDTQIIQTESKIKETMTAAGIDSFVSNKVEYIIKETLTTSIIKNRLPDLIYAAKANGCGDLVKTSINANTLSAYVRKYANENDGLIPEWVDGYIDLEVRTKLYIRNLK